MPKYKVLKPFRDINTGEPYKVNAIVNISTERHDNLQLQGDYLQRIVEPKKTTPKK